MMLEIPLKNPNPDFDYLARVLNGELLPNRVISGELLVDEEVKRVIIENYFNERNVPPPSSQRLGSSEEDTSFRETEDYKRAYRAYHKQLISFYCRMDYHFIPDLEFYLDFSSINNVSRVSKDSAILSRGERYWAQEDFGMIRSWEDFEKFPWEKAEKMLDDYGLHLEFMANNLPDGMKIAAQAAMFEPVLEWMLGYQGLFFASYDNPELVKAIFDKFGSLIYRSYEIAASMDAVGVIWHGDDLGYKTGTIISPEFLRKWVFPWFKKFGDVARKYNKPFWYHCCGNKSEIMSDLIDYCGFGAIHSFEDGCCSVIDYKRKYGSKIGLIGGVDIDKLARLDEDNLREYVRNILDNCMPGGKYIFGSGNSICNFIPVKNYLVMIDESRKWAYK